MEIDNKRSTADGGGGWDGLGEAEGDREDGRIVGKLDGEPATGRGIGRCECKDGRERAQQAEQEKGPERRLPAATAHKHL